MKTTISVCLLLSLLFPTYISAASATDNANKAEKAKLPLSGLLIGIDAGHQRKGNSGQEPIAPGSKEKKAKVSSGTTGKFTGIPEYQVNLDVALLLEAKLKELGADVLMVRTTHDVNIPNSERATMMNEADADLCIRIHANGSANPKVSGALMMIPAKKAVPDIYDASLKAGEILLENFIQATGAKELGVSAYSNMTGFNWSKVPVCLIEMGFMSNKQEDKLLVSPAYQEKCAQGLADGVVAWAKSQA
jgi:N-acetylmuramoyl-L-alanine amidase